MVRGFSTIVLISEIATKPADLSQRIIFKRKAPKDDNKKSTTEDKEIGSKKKEKPKESIAQSKLSFDLEDENYDSGKSNCCYAFLKIFFYPLRVVDCVALLFFENDMFLVLVYILS